MSGYSKNGRTTAGKVVFDWYKILQISPSSTPNEIKTAYYKIAQTAHPDKHNGCSTKLEQFKRINEAYDILSNPTKRNEYDMQMGHYGKSSYQRRTNVPKDYRKVYTSRPPPEWKMVWDHAKHYEMHYGDGFQKEAMKQAIKTAEQDGTFIYHSALGKGFTFHHLHDRSTSTVNGSANANYNHGATTNSTNYNPYSKNAVQGPPKIIFDYQEVTHNYGGDGSFSKSNKRQNILKHERIVYDLHLRRYERYREEVRHESQQSEQQKQEPGTADTATSKETTSAKSANTTSPIYSRYDWRYRQEQQQKQRQQNDSVVSPMNLFSSFIAATTIPNNSYSKSDAATVKTNKGDETVESEDYPKESYKPQEHNEMTDSSVKNMSCIIM